MRAALAVLVFVVLVVVAWFNGVFAVPINDIAVVSLAPGIDPGRCYDGDCRPVLELRFRTSVNLRRLVRDTGAITPLLFVSLCPFEDKHGFAFSPIYHGGISISDDICTRDMVRSGHCVFPNDTSVTRAEMETTKTNQPLIYSAYFEYTGIEPLPKAPEDLCFKISAQHAGLTPTQFTSSTVRIPAEILRHALLELQKRKASTRS